MPVPPLILDLIFYIILGNETLHEAPDYAVFFPTFLLVPSIYLNGIFSKTLSLCSFLNIRDGKFPIKKNQQVKL
jgi:hypothetical protein